ncbi:hypothetical protein F5883DRAFT_582143 [Diaporthe sp. PMI_573]|nr:hypothetical protein F5883DRAFT_582143 [Diaporthaceae sp. PMI_573]
MASTVCIQKPASIPAPFMPSHPAIAFYHPRYEAPDALFRLPRLDANALERPSPSSSSPSSSLNYKLGVHYRTALLACQIVANNAFGGFLATDREGQQRVTSQPDDILCNDEYWFIADASRPDDNYPVVPRFEDWVFPTGERPSFSAVASASERNLGRERHLPRPSALARCSISQVAFPIQQSHVVPRSQINWFKDNHMGTYSGEPEKGIDAFRNKIDLSLDLHYAWDSHIFALVPKTSSIVAHCLRVPLAQYEEGFEFTNRWHNTPLCEAATLKVPSEYLFARFAHAIFSLLKPFITSGRSRRIIKVNSEGVQETETLSRDDLVARYGGGGTVRSTSSSTGHRKRSRSQASFAVPSQDSPDHLMECSGRYTRRKAFHDGEPTNKACSAAPAADDAFVLRETDLSRRDDAPHTSRQESYRRIRDWVWTVDTELEGSEGDRSPLSVDGGDSEDGTRRGRTFRRGAKPPLELSGRDRTIDTIPSLTTDVTAANTLEKHQRQQHLLPEELFHCGNPGLQLSTTAKMDRESGVQVVADEDMVAAASSYRDSVDDA